MPIGAVSLMLRVLNIGNACLLAATCVLCFIWSANGSMQVALNVTQVRALREAGRARAAARSQCARFHLVFSAQPSPQTFLAVYMGVFAVMLFVFETRLSCSVNVIRRNFGFMFTYMGRTIFLIFVSAVAFGMLDSKNSGSLE